MNAYEIPSGQFTLNTSVDCVPHRFVAVDANGLAKHATAETDPIVGVSYTEALTGRPLSIIGGGIIMVEAAAEIAAGAFVTAGADGKAVAGGDKFVALTGAPAGALISVKL